MMRKALSATLVGGIILSALALTPDAVRAQAPPGGSTLIIQGANGPLRITSTGSIKVTPVNQQEQSQAPTQPASPDTPPDLFNSLISSAASIDMDSPVTARAEFDPPVVAAGGRAIFRIVLTALDESVKQPDQLPAPGGLTVTPGGRAQNYQPTGTGRLQPQTTLNYRVIPSTNGIYSMPSFTVLAYGKPVIVPEAQLVVVAPGTPGVKDAPHLIMDLPTNNVYVGEMLRIPVVLPDPGDGSVVGFYQTHIKGDAIFSEAASFGVRRDIVHDGGHDYAAFVQDVTITPMREGPQTLVAQANCNRIHSSQPGAFTSTLIDSDPRVLDVKSLPEDGRLAGFNGAVGALQVDTPQLSTNVIKAGDPLKMAVIVRGEGNLGHITPPQIPLQHDWQTFPPIADMTQPFVMQQRGFTVFEYTMIPLNERAAATPAIPFSCFDPKRGAYVDLTIPPMPVTVKPSESGWKTANANAAAAEDAMNQDGALALTGLAEGQGISAGSLRAAQQQWWFAGLQFVPAGLLVGLWSWDRRRRRLERHPEILRRKRARRGVKRESGLARKAAEERDAFGFATGAANALREACAPGDAANPEALVCADVLSKLPDEERRGREGEVVRKIFAAADAARFGANGRNGVDVLELRQDWEQVMDLLKARL